MTTSESSKLIGRTGDMNENGWRVRITIEDVRSQFGRVDVKLVPQAGGGYRWVSLERVLLDEQNRA